MTSLPELKRLAESATPGPWEWTKVQKRGNSIEGQLRGMFGDDPAIYPILNKELGVIDGATVAISKANAHFIAAANPQQILNLIGALEIAKDALNRMVVGFDQGIATTPNSYAAKDAREALAEIKKLVET